MRKKTWIALVLALAIGLGTAGFALAGSFTTIGDDSAVAGGHPDLPRYVYGDQAPVDDLLASQTSYKFAAYSLWLLP